MSKHRHQRKNLSTKKIFTICIAAAFGILLYLVFFVLPGRDKGAESIHSGPEPQEFRSPVGTPWVNGPTEPPPTY